MGDTTRMGRREEGWGGGKTDGQGKRFEKGGKEEGERRKEEIKGIEEGMGEK